MSSYERTHTFSFFAAQRRLFQFGYQVNPDVSLLGYRDENREDDLHENDEIISNNYSVSRSLKRFYGAEFAGSEIDYRCTRCRSCRDCKNHDHIAALSIKEEVEQDLIEQSVEVDIERCETIAKMPLLCDPSVKLHPNRHKALKTYNQQLKNHRLAKTADK